MEGRFSALSERGNKRGKYKGRGSGTRDNGIKNHGTQDTGSNLFLNGYYRTQNFSYRGRPVHVAAVKAVTNTQP